MKYDRDQITLLFDGEEERAARTAAKLRLQKLEEIRWTDTGLSKQRWDQIRQVLTAVELCGYRYGCFATQRRLLEVSGLSRGCWARARAAAIELGLLREVRTLASNGAHFLRSVEWEAVDTLREKSIDQTVRRMRQERGVTEVCSRCDGGVTEVCSRCDGGVTHEPDVTEVCSRCDGGVTHGLYNQSSNQESNTPPTAAAHQGVARKGVAGEVANVEFAWGPPQAAAAKDISTAVRLDPKRDRPLIQRVVLLDQYRPGLLRAVRMSYRSEELRRGEVGNPPAFVEAVMARRLGVPRDELRELFDAIEVGQENGT